ncbi:LexA family protein [Photobacterium lucens]|uniref:LexA family protein n=1 Tax=Photobacterium lucens TaxID=2562949 RepID=UPI00136A8DC3|nr:translesion error-prone DNA polymerase V autoproteolytic subunit [Photobacterium lucens]MBP2698757.1 translesion error-prone DNA polymerase V autoproteolytic subunit [Vibrio parahaemolyticus]MZG56665.1 translesion error-prone DNA polymerase V autoproteolytic subunit [Photobacterium lucens]MZG81291.1 translesion error-prone DNA polymerase V autoproteolytic subunit [Photobacterium lucens]
MSAYPYFIESVPCGFPSPADGHQESLDLDEYLIRHPNATFFLRASGESMIGAGIYDGDLLVVDRAETVAPGRIVIARIYDEFTCKRLVRYEGVWWLKAENPVMKSFPLPQDAEIFGVVTRNIHNLL